MYILQILAAALKPRPSEHATRIGDYQFSYQREVMGQLFYFTVQNAVNEAEARMRAQVEMAKRAKTEGALEGSQRLVLD